MLNVFLHKAHEPGEYSVVYSNIFKFNTSYFIFQQMESRILHSLEQASAQQDLNKSLLRLTYLLQQSEVHISRA